MRRVHLLFGRRGIEQIETGSGDGAQFEGFLRIISSRLIFLPGMLV